MDTTSAQDPNRPSLIPFQSARQILAEAVAAHAFPGCAFGVLAGDTVLAEDARGGLTYEGNSPQVEPTTVFDIASITKVASTTALVMLLQQRGQLALDMKLADVLPGFIVGRPRAQLARYVKIRHLLEHTSGLPGYVPLYRTVTTPEEMLRACLQVPLEAEPGARAEYSDLGFILLGKAIEVVTGKELDVLFNEEIAGPLGLTASSYCPPRRERESIPPTEEDTTLRHRRIQGEVQDENAWRLRGVAGHAGLFSNVTDLLRLANEILTALRVGNGQLYQRETVELFAQRQGPEGSSRALGWDTPSEHSSAGNRFSTHSIGHLGYSGCSLWIDLESEIAVALLTNRTWPDRTDQQIRQIRPAFHNAVRSELR
ncbi:MAG: serine hydrolase [Terracidiphilus sp.]|nr:serine hydrolase [Terracidiphilus sp.]